MRAITIGILAMSWLAAVESSGQTHQGGVRGSVRDSAGVIPGVVVTLTAQSTNW